ncbi:MAG: hypothetical protein ACRCUY_07565, partial [Thermoguttaceae bacterium]
MDRTSVVGILGVLFDIHLMILSRFTSERLFKRLFGRLFRVIVQTVVRTVIQTIVQSDCSNGYSDA